MRGEHAVGRVIARPFRGRAGRVRAHRRPPRPRARRRRRAPTCEELQAARVPVHTVGKIGQVFAGVGIDRGHPGADQRRRRSRSTEQLIDELDGGLVFTNLVETDQVYGHRGDVPGFHEALQVIDAAVGGWLERLDPERDLLVLTADHGCDPTTPGTDHTREHVPLLARFAGHGGAPPRRAVRRRRRLRAALAGRDATPRRCPASRSSRESGRARGGSLAALACWRRLRRRPARRRPTADARRPPRQPPRRRKPGDVEQLERAAEAPRRRARARPAARVRRHRRPAPQRDRDREVARNARGLPLRDVALHGRRHRRQRPRARRSRSARSTASAACAARSTPPAASARAARGTGWRVAQRVEPRASAARGSSARYSRGAHRALRRARAAGPDARRADDRARGAATRAWATCSRAAPAPPLPRRRGARRAGGARADRATSAGSSRSPRSPTPRCSETGPRRSGSARSSRSGCVVVWPPFSALDADGAAARRHPRADPRGARRRRPRAARRVADRGDRALRRPGPPRRRRRPLPRRRGQRPRPPRAEPARALRARRDRAAQRRRPGGRLRLRARPRRSTIADRYGRRRCCGSTTPSTTRTCRGRAGARHRPRRAIRRTLGDLARARSSATCAAGSPRL